MKLLTSLSLAAAAILTVPVGAAAISPDHTQDKNIVETAVVAGNFKTLLTAAQAAGLVEPLVGKGPLTVLAPTDEAFAKLGDKAISEVLRPENKESLARILKYHVIAGSIKATDALKAGSAPSLMGQEVSFTLAGGRLRINGEVNVIANDIMASNGVIHVIDQVLIPDAPQPEGRLVIGFFSDKPGEQLAKYLGVNRNECLLVTEITKGSEAAKAGLEAYDLIVAINGKKATQESIREVKEDVGFGGKVRLDVLRRGKKVRIDSKVGVEDH